MERPEAEAAVAVGVQSQFWLWLQGELEIIKKCATNELTQVPPTPDNLGEIARLQERVNLADRLLRKPYDFLGNPTPR